MKLSLTIAVAILANLMFAEIAKAQSAAANELNAEVDSEIEQMYQQQNTSNINAPSADANAANRSVVTQTVYVPQQPVVQKQPETTVESSPLSNSRADGIRRGRQEEELRTESKIVE